jgi:prophage maintenance system killer protein
MENKYRMTVEQNIFVAKRNIIDYIWKSAKLEGLAVTYPDTEAIYNGMSVSGVKVSEIIAVNNLKHAWQFVLDNLCYPIDYPYICKINQLVGGDNLIINAGFLRNVPVTIGGTSWRPDIPIESQIKEELSEMQHLGNPTDRAITLMLYLMRKQMFLDGNKRTAMLTGNQIMISSGCGIISVPIEQQRDFTATLVQFYESNDMEPLKAFVYNYCIDGIVFEPATESEADWKNGNEGKENPENFTC